MGTKKHATKLYEYLHGHSQADFARIVGVSNSAVCTWCSGERKPNKYLMPDILKALSRLHGKKIVESDVWP